MEILELGLDQLANQFKSAFGKGLYHASALYREVFQFGNHRFLTAKEFINSPALTKKLENHIVLKPGEVVETFYEDDLIKFVTRLWDGQKIESVIIPMTNHHTLCVSSQVGCRMGCRFCETGKMGFKRNLTISEITGQLFNARFTLKKKIRNVVFMGMGEPFHNFDNVSKAIRIMNEQKGFNVACRRITVSTAGVAGGIEKLGTSGMKAIRLAVSINTPDENTRSWLMPVSLPLKPLKKALLSFPLAKRGAFLFEYILIGGINDSLQDAVTLAEYCKSLPVRLNLIPYNPVEGFDYDPPSDVDMHRFADVLTSRGVFVVKRWSRGRSVFAGCGQLGLR